MKINIEARLKNKVFLISMSVLLISIIYKVLSLFGIAPSVDENATDFELYKGKETYTPDENGDVTVKSVSPTMTLTTNNANVTLSCEYNKDLNKCISQIYNALSELEGLYVTRV